MKKILKHHSVSDWDFEHGATYRSLSTDYFVSPPTSLKIYKAGSPYVLETILCRAAATLLLPEGELRTWVRSGYTTNRVFTFRNQEALNAASDTNCYLIQLTSTTWRLYRVIAGGFSLRGSTGASHSGTTLECWRVIWWNGFNVAGDPALCVELYKDVLSVWVKQGNTLYDTSNQFKDSGINRVGLSCQTVLNVPVYFDDTEIWGPV